MHKDGYRVTETFKVTFQQLYSAIYRHMPYSTPVQTSSFSLSSTSVQALAYALVTQTVPVQGVITMESFITCEFYCCSTQSPQLSYSRRSQGHLLGWHQGADKAGLFLHCVGCGQDLVPAVLGPKAYVSLLWSAVSALCDFPLSPCGPRYQAYFPSVSPIQEERTTPYIFSGHCSFAQFTVFL